MTCNDCGGPPRKMTEAALKRGSQVREPGEALCASCSSSRMLMMRAVDRIPKSLADIKAKRLSLKAVKR